MNWRTNVLLISIAWGALIGAACTSNPQPSTQSAMPPPVTTPGTAVSAEMRPAAADEAARMAAARIADARARAEATAAEAMAAADARAAEVRKLTAAKPDSIPATRLVAPDGSALPRDITRKTSAKWSKDDAKKGWLSWRGPHQNGTSDETGLFERLTLDGENHLWSYPLAGRGTPVIADGRVYATGYEGEGVDLQEKIVCLFADTGQLIWERAFSDFLSDVIYNRYAISSPVIDPATGDVFFLSTAGLLNCFSPDGLLRWQVSMPEMYGRLTFPNGRTGAPIVDDDLVIIHIISSSWGPLGPARDRFYAFDKKSGANVWSSTPGGPPKDSPYSYPVLAWEGSERVLYSGTGCGFLVCVNARTGDPIWRYPMSIGGVNASVVLDDDSVIAWHGRENLDGSSIGRMISVRREGASPDAGAPPVERPATLKLDREEWRNDLGAFTSSPVLAGNRIYATDQTGELCAVNADTGQLLWKEKLAPDQIHASPVYADGKLYVPMNNGSFHVVRPTDAGIERLAEVQLAGNALGAPAVADGRVYVHTTSQLYCFGERRPTTQRPAPDRWRPARGEATRLQFVPAEVLLQQGESAAISVRSLDANGQVASRTITGLEWAAPLPPGVTIDDTGWLRVAADSRPAAVKLTASAGDLAGSLRLRIVPRLPYTEDFEGFALSVAHKVETGVNFAYPPGQWIGGRLKWEVREQDGSKVLAKTLDNSLFQRATTLLGHPDMHNYTAQVDIMSDGNRRTLSSAGVINQRYLFLLKGNHQQLQISSNDERLKETVPYKWKANVWYRLKTRVDFISEDTAIVRGKVWPRDEPEPAAWTIEVEHHHAHQQGSPALFGFTPQSRFRVYLDNLQITPNLD